jgi:dihydroorotate dehydrogenase
VGSYWPLARTLLFQLDPEYAHDLTMAALRMPGVMPLLSIGHRPSSLGQPPLQQTLWDLTFANPLGLAAGLDKQGTALHAWSALGFGFAEIGTVTPRPQPGNPKPRLFRLPEDLAIVNRFGFNSDGAPAVARNLDQWRGAAERSARARVRLGVNVGRNKDTPNERAVDDYVAAIETLRPFADYFVINVSSPNTAGLRDLQQHDTLRPLMEHCVAAARAAGGRRVPVLVKVSPDIAEGDLLRSVDAALEGGAAGIVATNTTLSRDGLKTLGPITREAGGLSGAPLRHRANQACRLLFRHLGPAVPIVGAGGIANADHAYERLRSGASLLQVYTAMIYEGPGLVTRILNGLAERLARDGFRSIGEAIGVDIR